MHLELNDEQADALERELARIIQNDWYPLSPRIVALKEMMRPEPEREPPPPPPKVYAPPTKGRWHPRRG
jgi:hypothetical protein